MLFSTGMTVGHLAGDEVGLRLCHPILLQGGTVVGALGLALALLAPGAPVALAGFFLVGLGMANCVSIVFSQAGRQRAMPPSFAIPAMSYGATLVGPGAVGLLATAIWL